MEKNNIIIQTILLIIIATITAYFGISMPIISLAYPIMLTFTGVKIGMSKHILTLAASLAILGLITQDINVLIIPLQYGILSIFTAYMINKKYETKRIILYSSGLVFAMVIIHMGLNWSFGGINTFMELEGSLTAISKEQIDLLKTQDMDESERSQMVNMLKNMVDLITSIIPALLIVSSTLIAYLNYYASSRLVKNSGIKEIDIPKFSMIIFPKHVIMGLGMTMLISYALKYVGDFNYLQLLNNLWVLIYAIFLIEGLSLTVFLINKMKIGNFLKVLFITIIALSSLLNIILFSIGMIDIIFDFRKIRKMEKM